MTLKYKICFKSIDNIWEEQKEKEKKNERTEKKEKKFESAFFPEKEHHVDNGKTTRLELYFYEQRFPKMFENDFPWLCGLVLARLTNLALPNVLFISLTLYLYLLVRTFISL